MRIIVPKDMQCREQQRRQNSTEQPAIERQDTVDERGQKRELCVSAMTENYP
jgi:hypothetical protein